MQRYNILKKANIIIFVWNIIEGFMECGFFF